MRHRQVALLGNPNTKRTSYLKQAAEQTGLPVLFLDWNEWKAHVPNEELFLKIDPPLWESCSLRELDNLVEEYIVQLIQLIHIAKEQPIEFFNHPSVIMELLDKRKCKERLWQEKLPVTELLEIWDRDNAIGKDSEPRVFGSLVQKNSVRTVEQLLEAMKEKQIYQVFIKPVNGSGAAGVTAFRYQPRTGRMALYTCARFHEKDGLINTKRLNRYDNLKEVETLLGQILQMGCIVERWYAKAKHYGKSYDLRVVIQDNAVDYVLARLSDGPITNLHLNNHPLPVKELGLSIEIRDQIDEICKRAMNCYSGLRSAGIDILLENGSLKPRVIEMNAQGDLIYQDIYHENKIYHHQAKMMKQWLDEIPRI